MLGCVAVLGCTKRNPEVCCETDLECKTVGLDSPAPCGEGVCVNYRCVASGCDDDGDCHDPDQPMCVAGQCFGPADACREGGGSRIVFLSNRDSETQIYSEFANGASLTQLTHADETMFIKNVVPSPDGAHLAYIQTGDVFVMADDGSDSKQLTSGESNQDIQWSPDGMKLAVSPFMARDVSSSTMQADGSQRHMLSVAGFSTLEPVWSPDSARVAFVAANVDTMQVALWTSRVDGTGGKSFFNGDYPPSYGLSSLDWNPDGAVIAFLYPDDGGTGTKNTMWLEPLDGTPAHVLKTADYPVWEVRWSHDGSKVVFVESNASNAMSEDDGGQSISIMNADGSGQVRFAAVGSHPRWSIDDRYVLFHQTEPSGNRQLYRMDSDGTNVVGLAMTSSDDYDAEWMSCAP
jgi:Tol biopolymer transport system component